MATHSSVLAWEIPWTEEPGGLWSMGSQSWTRLLTRQQQHGLGSPPLGSTFRVAPRPTTFSKTVGERTKTTT